MGRAAINTEPRMDTKHCKRNETINAQPALKVWVSSTPQELTGYLLFIFFFFLSKQLTSIIDYRSEVLKKSNRPKHPTTRESVYLPPLYPLYPLHCPNHQSPPAHRLPLLRLAVGGRGLLPLRGLAGVPGVPLGGHRRLLLRSGLIPTRLLLKNHTQRNLLCHEFLDNSG